MGAARVCMSEAQASGGSLPHHTDIDIQISLNADFSDQEMLINMYKFELNNCLNICLLNISHPEPEYITNIYYYFADSSKVASKVKTDLNACKSSSKA